MKIRIENSLLMTSATLENGGRQLTLTNVIIDTGSSTTIFATERLATIGVSPQPDDVIREVRGIGGSEYVLSKTLRSLSVGNLLTHDFAIEMGAASYGFDFDGILGLDFLTRVKAIIDLDIFELRTTLA